ncbi:hypothetical protein LEMLEM_LOCUS2208 [Lemmus lemmus]
MSGQQLRMKASCPVSSGNQETPRSSLWGWQVLWLCCPMVSTS